MAQPDRFVAKLLVASAAGYASASATRLLEKHPDVEARFAPGGWSGWRAFFLQRIHDLAAAVSVGVPEVFAGRMTWARQSFVARSIPDEDLRSGLTCLGEVLDAELPESASGAVAPALAVAMESLQRSLSDEPSRLNGDTVSGRVALQYLVAAIEGDSRGAIASVIEAVENGLSLEQVYSDVLMIVQWELGRMWHAGELSIAQEHLVTTTTQRLMAVLSFRNTPADSNGRRVVFAGVSGDVHDIALRALADLFESCGWHSICLGSDLPDTEIAAASDYFGADLLLLSATLPQHLEGVEKTILALKELENRTIPVIVGGTAYQSTGDLWRRQGADAYAADFGSALEMAENLLSGTEK
ncbi:MAG: cobalamin-dependent protein [Gammaproteobacteria bacterium]|nr:MAG: cobalamin-dependent protein [Gammaproteobacteria bacterium]